eukprot:13017298-Alexandrium_andersonii.AAC.1
MRPLDLAAYRLRSAQPLGASRRLAFRTRPKYNSLPQACLARSLDASGSTVHLLDLRFFATSMSTPVPSRD